LIIKDGLFDGALPSAIIRANRERRELKTERNKKIVVGIG
jgi:hypothetical protein